MNVVDHDARFKEVMEYLDGELQAAEAHRVRQHLDSCAECRAIADDFRTGSKRMAQWSVEPAPRVDLRTSASHRVRSFQRIIRSRAIQLAAAATLVVATTGTYVIVRPARKMPQQPAAASVRSIPEGSAGTQWLDQPTEAAAQRKGLPLARRGSQPVEATKPVDQPLLVVRAHLTIIPRDFEASRRELERIVAAAGGFTGRIVVSGSHGAPRSLVTTVRIPAPRLDEALTALRKLGTVTEENRDAEDVTQQSVDLNARLSNGRASEARLKDILERQTGALSDVLAVEWELARVRGEIERMEAERKSLDGRISYASVTIQMSEERKASVDLGPQPLSTQFRNAFVDGWTMLATLAVGIGLLGARLLPTVVVLALALTTILMYRRRFRLGRSLIPDR